MISLLAAPSSLQLDEGAGPSLAAARARIFQLDPRIEPGTSAFNAALILVLGRSVGQNIDRIARVARLNREVVAQHARRLVDNGVWSDGETVCLWGDSTHSDVEAFCADVAIAEGKVCRRINELGEMEWAPQGHWRKHYEYVAPKGGSLPPFVCYHPQPEVLDQDYLYLPEPPDEVEVEEQRMAHPAQAIAAESNSPEMWLETRQELEPATINRWTLDVGSTSGDLFPEADWLT